MIATAPRSQPQPRHAVKQLRYVGSDDGAGGSDGQWNVLRTLRMAIVPLAGLEEFHEQQLQVRASHKFFGRFVSDLTTRDRLQKADGRLFDITEIINVQELSREMVVRTVERQAA